MSVVSPTVFIEFETTNVSVSENDGFATVNLVRTGNHTNDITVYISVTRIEDPAIVQCTYRVYVLLSITNSVSMYDTMFCKYNILQYMEDK